MSAAGPILLERVGAVLRIRLAREEARNAQSRQLLDELDRAFAEAAEDAGVNVVILAGNGRHFSSGHDLKQAQAERAGFTVEERWHYESERYLDYCLRIRDFPKPTIAQVQGGAIAAGFMLANMCDLIVAAEDAFFSDPVSYMMGAAATEVLVHPWVMPARIAKEFLFTGNRMSAQRGYEIGFVNRIVPAADIDRAAMELATHISAAPPFAMRLVKRSLNRSEDVRGFKEAISAHFDIHQLSHVTAEYGALARGGVAASIKKISEKSG